MVSLIEAKKSGNEEAVKSILLSHKDLQLRRRMEVPMERTNPRGTKRGRGGRRGGSLPRSTLPSLLPYPQVKRIHFM